jgi:hypothetical protein
MGDGMHVDTAPKPGLLPDEQTLSTANYNPTSTGTEQGPKLNASIEVCFSCICLCWIMCLKYFSIRSSQLTRREAGVFGRAARTYGWYCCPC